MKPQEKDRIENAIRHIQTATDVDPWAAQIAVDAMRKQIPVKPVHIDKNNEFDGNWIKICPSCKRVLILPYVRKFRTVDYKTRGD